MVTTRKGARGMTTYSRSSPPPEQVERFVGAFEGLANEFKAATASLMRVASIIEEQEKKS